MSSASGQKRQNEQQFTHNNRSRSNGLAFTRAPLNSNSPMLSCLSRLCSGGKELMKISGEEMLLENPQRCSRPHAKRLLRLSYHQQMSLTFPLVAPGQQGYDKDRKPLTRAWQKVVHQHKHSRPPVAALACRQTALVRSTAVDCRPGDGA